MPPSQGYWRVPLNWTGQGVSFLACDEETGIYRCGGVDRSNATCRDIALPMELFVTEQDAPGWMAPSMKDAWLDLQREGLPPSERFPSEYPYGCIGGSTGVLCGACESGTVW